MRVTIVKEDNFVAVDGEGHAVDCSDLPADFHALQWHDTEGEVEHSSVRCAHCNTRSKRANEMVLDFAPFQTYVDRWQVARAAVAAAKAAALEAAEKARADATGPET